MEFSRHAPDRTLPLTVKNTGFLLDRLGQDCHPLQFLRELTENSIQAIQRSGETGEIIWDVEWTYYDLHDGVLKLCIIDSGDGMNGSEMQKYINQLSSSIEEQSLNKNYGIGAKIAALTRNPSGVIYQSWKSARGSMIHAWKSPESGEYGLKQFERDGGTYAYHVEIEDELRPPIIKDHGTVVILMGKSEDENTIQPPEGIPSPSRWISKHLNTRYFRIPDCVTIKAREGWEYPRNDSSRNKLRTVTGQEKYLGDHGIARGTVSLTGAVSHWWILKDSEALGQDSNYYASSGHMAALYQDELYEMASSRAGTARLQEFGVIFGCRQVVIYIEPVADDRRRLTTNTARTQLLINNEPLPWADWAAEFRERMPKEIEALIAEKAATASGVDHSATIRDRLKAIMDLYKVSRYRVTADGTINVDPERLTRGGDSTAQEAMIRRSHSTKSGGTAGGTAGSIYALFEKKKGVPGEHVEPNPFPIVKWITVEDGTREAGDLEDRAARYITDQNLLLINGDFRVFTDMMKYYHKEFGGSAAIREVVRDVVRSWFEQSLVEAVIGVQQLQNSREWSEEQIRVGLSEEALTTAVVPRYHINVNARRELGSKLGRPKTIGTDNT